MPMKKNMVPKKLQPGSQTFNEQLTVQSISLQNSVVAGESNAGPSIEDSQTVGARY